MPIARSTATTVTRRLAVGRLTRAGSLVPAHWWRLACAGSLVAAHWWRLACAGSLVAAHLRRLACAGSLVARPRRRLVLCRRLGDLHPPYDRGHVAGAIDHDHRQPVATRAAV